MGYGGLVSNGTTDSADEDGFTRIFSKYYNPCNPLLSAQFAVKKGELNLDGNADRRQMKLSLLYESETYNIIGAAMAVHNELGSGFLEAVYQEALEYEFTLNNIPASKEVSLQIFYKERLLSKYYIADFVCYDKIIIELKSVPSLRNEHNAQILNYLKATKFKLGLLVNFGTAKLEYKRIICEHPQSSAQFAVKKEENP
jgi:GxxExxY protein